MAPQGPRTALVVPCFDEAPRLPIEAFLECRAADPRRRFYLVDDGSRDGTLERLHALESKDPEGFRVIARAANGGKGAAVWTGLQQALADQAEHVGYWDADLATPLAELSRFEAVLDAEPACQVVLGSRVLLLGRHIERNALRHYVGRVFATAASLTLALPVYDTQCGAKLLRNTEAVREALAAPFRTRWTFDVELLARLVASRRERGRPDNDGWVRELPLETWIDVPGSKVTPLDLLRSLGELAAIRRRTRRGRH